MQQGDREKFEAYVANAVEAEFKKCVESGISPRCNLKCDYDPWDILLDAVHAAGVECRGCMYSAEGILPMKHNLRVTPGKLEPKEGYGHWTAPITVAED